MRSTVNSQTPLPKPVETDVQRTFELSCGGCGYGVVVRVAPERCPMCGASTWQFVGRRRIPAAA